MLPTSAMVNGRITGEQMAWLEERAAELDGNLSAALRQAITDARILEMAREDYRYLVKHCGLEIPRYENGNSAMLSIAMMELTDTEDLELRKREKNRRSKK
jgi:hypothetical protein